MEIGQTLAHYRVVASLGAGGMGEVYRATDAKLGRSVALKILPPRFASDENRVARFRREARMLASLNHPNIAAIYGFEEAGDVRALVLELVEGPTLDDQLRDGPLPVGEALAIARQIAAALGAAHDRGIIHRDLKPGNIKLTPDSTVKILDFGIAKALHDETAALSLGGQLKSGKFWTVKTGNSSSAKTGEFYFVSSSVRKSVWTFVRQLRGPHLRTWA